MIVTRTWLEEWIDLDGIATDALCKTFNAIGLEVDRVERYAMPEKIVVGKVVSCEKHPDAEKLNVCQVEIGDKLQQIVCGAANVAAGQWVPVATLGAVMPSGMEIKPVKLRGVDSAGMICSSTELGLPKLNDGILVLDESIGALKAGLPLGEIPAFNDDLIEIELTANRGDCLSIRGVARDLCAALERTLKSVEYTIEGDRRLGIGRLVSLEVEGDIRANVSYHAVEVSTINLPLCMALRLAQIEESYNSAVDGWMLYATHSTGVILRAYDSEFFHGEGKKPVVKLALDEHGFAAVFGQERASVIGIRQEDISRVDDSQRILLVEASYITPELISKQIAEKKVQSGPLFYRTSRGSEPELKLGVKFLFSLLEQHPGCMVYGGREEHTDVYEPRVVSFGRDEVTEIIGAVIDKTRIAAIFKNLGFDIAKSTEDRFIVSIPRFRHDLHNKQDLIEEIVRIVGIDNIPAKPFVLTEADRLGGDYFEYKKRYAYRMRAVQSGFYESVHFVFNEREQLEKLGFACVDPSLELLNPIAGTLDTLRPTLLAGLLNAASSNAKNGKARIPLFEIGSVFDAQRRESVKMALLFAGELHDDAIDNAGKPATVTFESFSKLLADVIGDIKLKPAKPTHALAHPYQAAAVYRDSLKLGELFTLHPTLQAELDLPRTVLFEGDFDVLEYALVQAKPYSKFQASFRDLSLVMPREMAYEKLANVIEGNRSAEIIRFYPVDRYTDAALGDQVSLTLRFVLQSQEKTLEEEDITSAMQGVLDALQSGLGITLR